MVGLWVGGCTAVYHRDFVVEMEPPSSIAERQHVVDRYRQFMESNGYTASSTTNARGSWVSFTIRDARSRMLPTSRISDWITVGIDVAGDIQVQIYRITSYPPDDFSEKYLADFVALTAKYMSESSGKVVNLRIVKAK